MTREEFDNLNSDGKVKCPDCGLSYTIPYPGCGCPMRYGGYGSRHINKYHHDCEDAIAREKVYHQVNIYSRSMEYEVDLP